MTTEEEIKHRHAVIAECQGAIKRRLDDIDRMKQLDITQPNNLTTGSGHPIGSVSGDLLREVLVAGIRPRWKDRRNGGGLTTAASSVAMTWDSGRHARRTLIRNRGARSRH